MKHLSNFGSLSVGRDAAQRTLITEMEHLVLILNAEIASEEQQARIFDRSQSEYPILARGLAARRDNLLDTIAELKRRLPVIEVA